MSIWLLLTLTGYVFDILGAFVLGTDAIGVDRIKRWSDTYLSVFSQLTTPPPDSLGRPGLARITVALCGAGGGTIGFLIIQLMPKAHDVIFTSLGLLVGAISAPLIYFVAADLIRRIAHLLSKLHHATEAKAVGLFGFVMIFLGFILQFIGTLGGALNKT